ncbi:hypothetical protein L603_001600000180 [Cellulosimicrobium cellulans J34]|nr:hypothetical protein L603_001600000180 [Cellulosimicrobium cellulans J34]SMF05152.1 hypothetical protein SAMN02744115_01123 [Cellulosimicrobium cellulans J1]
MNKPVVLLAGAFAAAMIHIPLGPTSALPDGDGGIFSSGFQNDQAIVHGSRVPHGGAEYVPASASGAPASEAFRRGPAYRCFDGDQPRTHPGLVQACPEGQNAASLGLECEADEFAMDPLFRQTWTNNADGSRSGVSGWELVNDGACVGTADLAAEAEAAFRQLTIAPSPIVVQPPDGWTLVNVPTITYTEPGEQVLDTTLLGIPVQVRATPTSYTWDYGDGSGPVTTTDPGAAYPAHTVAHTYEQPADQVTIALTTTWTGQFRITGTPTWTDVAGTATTTSSTDPLRVYEARSRLVADDFS